MHVVFGATGVVRQVEAPTVNEPAASPLTEKPFTVIGAMPWFDSVIVREAGAAFCGSGSGKTRLDGSASSGPQLADDAEHAGLADLRAGASR